MTTVQLFTKCKAVSPSTVRVEIKTSYNGSVQKTLYRAYFTGGDYFSALSESALLSQVPDYLNGKDFATHTKWGSIKAFAALKKENPNEVGFIIDEKSAYVEISIITSDWIVITPTGQEIQCYPNKIVYKPINQ